MTILYKDCGYFNEEIDDPYSPYPDECEDCYRYEICLRAKEKEGSSMSKCIDNKLCDLGFTKVADESDDSVVVYQRWNDFQNYAQNVEIVRKSDGTIVISSYQSETNSDGFNNSVGLTFEEMALIVEKCISLKIEYGW